MILADKVLLVLILAMLVLAPLGLGSVPGFDAAESEPGWWMGFFQALGPWHLFLLLGAGLGALLMMRAPVPARSARWPLAMLAGLGVLALIQCVPLPPALGSLLAPAATAHREALGITGWQPISWEPSFTLREAARVGVHLALIATVALLFVRRGTRWFLAYAVIAVAGLEAAYGMLETFALGDGILGFGKEETGKVTGTFIDKNHMAALMELGIPLALAILIHRRGGVLKRVLLGAAALAMAVATVLTLSRAAYGAMFGAVIVFLFLRYRQRGGAAGKVTFVIFLVVLTIVPLLIVESYPPLAERFSYGVSDRGFFDIRFPAWTSTLEMVGEQPVLGTGLGSFGKAIHAYQSTQVPDELHYAHNDALNLLSDGGGIGLLLGAAFVVLVLLVGLKRAGGPDGQDRTLAIGGVAGAVGVLLHSMFEFNLQIPGVTVALAIVAGLVLGRERGESPKRLSGRLAWPVAAMGLILLVAGPWLAVASARRALLTSRAGQYLRDENAEEAARLYEIADRPLGLGKACLTLAGAGDRDALERARRSLAEASERHHLRDEPWFRRGQLAMSENRLHDAYDLFLAARRFSRGRGEVNLQIGYMLFIKGVRRKEPDLIDAGAAALREAGEIDPELFSRGFGIVEQFVNEVELLRRIIPDTTYGHARMVGVLRRAGRFDEAVEEQEALERIEKTASSAYMLAEILIEAGRPEQAGGPLRRYVTRSGISEKTIDGVHRAYTARKRFEEAREFFERFVKGPGRRVAHAHYRLACVLGDLGRQEEATNAIREAIILDDRDERYTAKRREIQAER
jgi:O-antigen ligase/tetratricopeptide (TPR) repeat protein